MKLFDLAVVMSDNVFFAADIRNTKTNGKYRYYNAPWADDIGPVQVDGFLVDGRRFYDLTVEWVNSTGGRLTIWVRDDEND